MQSGRGGMRKEVARASLLEDGRWEMKDGTRKWLKD
jgi:hypothetical protein